MKRLIIVLLTASLLLTGCSKPKSAIEIIDEGAAQFEYNMTH